MTQWNINLDAAFDNAMGKLETYSDDEIWVPWWPDGEIGGPRPLILFKRFNTAGSIALFQTSTYSPQILIEKF